MRLPLVPLLLSCLSACTVAPDEPEEVGAAEGELRRLDFLQNRSMSVVAQDGHSLVLPIDLSNTFSPASGAFASGGVSSVHAVNWVGDANSYVDAFGYPLDGSFVSGGRVARFHYPFASNSTTAVLRFCLPGAPCPPMTPSPTSVKLDVAAALGHDARAVRMYDAGECSGESQWSEVSSSIGHAIATNLDTQLRAKGLGATTLHSITVTPRLGKTSVDNAQDRVVVTSSYDIATCSGRLYIDFAGSFGAAGRMPTFTVESASIRTSMDFGDDVCAVGPAMATGHFFDVGGLEREIADGVKTGLGTMLGPGIAAGITRAISRAPLPNTCTATTDCLGFVRAAMTLGGFSAAASALAPANAACLPKVDAPTRSECVFVPNVQRINTRVDGIEVVLASFSTDPFVAPLRSGGVCNRPEPPAAPAFGFMPLANPNPPTMFTAAASTVP
ncbi:MAG: hypothetical protein ACXVEE_41655 [Polyangiales bacterium]